MIPLCSDFRLRSGRAKFLSQYRKIIYLSDSMFFFVCVCVHVCFAVVCFNPETRTISVLWAQDLLVSGVNNVICNRTDP